MKKLTLFILLTFSIASNLFANRILIPMDETQKNHLKAYGIAFWLLKTHGAEVEWLLNYKGGSFLFTASQTFINECVIYCNGPSSSDACNNDVIWLKTQAMRYL